MLRVFVSEYVCGGGWPGETIAGSLATEGRAMLCAIVEDFSRIAGVQVVTTWDARLGSPPFRSAHAVTVKSPADELVAPRNGQLVASPITGNIWAVLTKEGEHVTAGQKIVVVEAMKMEVGVESPVAGIVKKIAVAPGKMVSAGQSLAIVEEKN